MKNILFVCTGNTCRSPMAEAIFNKLARQENLKVRAKSVGTYVVDDKVEDKARVALRQMGIVIRHKPTMFSKDMVNKFDIILTMTIAQKHYLKRSVWADNIYSIAEFINGIDISDPYGLSQKEYNETAKLLEFSIKNIIKKLEK